MADVDAAEDTARAGITVRVIVGPTAAGKSDIAMWLAERHPIVVVSADSRQIYRGFDIGTAKPTGAQRARVQHRGIDIAEPTARSSAFSWAASASGWIEEALATGRAPLVVGGTGLYVRALFGQSFEEPELAQPARAQLDSFLASLPLLELRRWCLALDPARSHLGRTQLLRAIEVALLSGHRLSDLHVTRARPSQYRARYLLVDPGRSLGERIAMRARTMLTEGWVNEVRALERTVPYDAPAWNSTGYRAVRSIARGDAGEDDALERIIIDTRQYAKRQRTWFRHQLPANGVTRIDPMSEGWEVAVERWWNEESAP